MTITLTGPQRAALLRMPGAAAPAQPRPRWAHRETIMKLMAAGLAEEPSPGLYRRTAAGDAVLHPEPERAR